MTDVYPIPPIDDLIDELGQAKFVVMLDLTQGYWKVPVAEEDNHKGFITPYGLLSENGSRDVSACYTICLCKNVF